MRRSEGFSLSGQSNHIIPHPRLSNAFFQERKSYLLAIRKSEAKGILEQCEAGAFHMDNSTMSITEGTIEQMGKLLLQYFDLGSNYWKPNLSPLSKYTALESAKTLANTIESAIE